MWIPLPVFPPDLPSFFILCGLLFPPYYPHWGWTLREGCRKAELQDRIVLCSVSQLFPSAACGSAHPGDITLDCDLLLGSLYGTTANATNPFALASSLAPVRWSFCIEGGQLEMGHFGQAAPPDGLVLFPPGSRQCPQLRVLITSHHFLLYPMSPSLLPLSRTEQGLPARAMPYLVRICPAVWAFTEQAVRRGAGARRSVA